ncbi:MAG: Plug domain-containing protein, partial [Pseudomonadota bacterium]
WRSPVAPAPFPQLRTRTRPSARRWLLLIENECAIATGVDEITVTAQKREENRQDIPVSVSALDADAIEKTFARDIQDVESLSPNLVIDPILGNGTAAISIRGMQLNDVEKSFDPAVAVYLDGVYLATTTGALLQIWDAESVEVLRGPQGTLFGRNTIGGLLHVLAANAHRANLAVA